MYVADVMPVEAVWQVRVKLLPSSTVPEALLLIVGAWGTTVQNEAKQRVSHIVSFQYCGLDQDIIANTNFRACIAYTRYNQLNKQKQKYTHTKKKHTKKSTKQGISSQFFSVIISAYKLLRTLCKFNCFYDKDALFLKPHNLMTAFSLC